MTTNERIARWLGWTQVYDSELGTVWKHPSKRVYLRAEELTDYSGSDSAAIQLLNELIKPERGYGVELYNNINDLWCVRVCKGKKTLVITDPHPTIAAAICGAILELIEKEGKGD